MPMYHPQTGKFLAVLAQNIPQEISGDVMQGWIDNPKALQKALRSALCPPTEKAERETGKAPDLKNAAGVRKGLKGFKDRLRALLCQDAFTVTTEAGEVDFVRVSNADLGRPNGCQYQQTCQLGVALGLELCESDDAANMWLNYKGQQLGEWLIMAMKDIRGPHGGLDVFDVVHDGEGLWLDEYYVRPDRFFLGDDRFVFRLPRKQPLAV